MCSGSEALQGVVLYREAGQDKLSPQTLGAAQAYPLPVMPSGRFLGSFLPLSLCETGMAPRAEARGEA